MITVLKCSERSRVSVEFKINIIYLKYFLSKSSSLSILKIKTSEAVSLVFAYFRFNPTNERTTKTNKPPQTMLNSFTFSLHFCYLCTDWRLHANEAFEKPRHVSQESNTERLTDTETHTYIDRATQISHREKNTQSLTHTQTQSDITQRHTHTHTQSLTCSHTRSHKEKKHSHPRCAGAGVKSR